MKQFKLKIVLFCMPLLLLAIAAEILARSIPNNYRYKYEWMEAHKDSVETLILGDSHLWGGS